MTEDEGGQMMILYVKGDMFQSPAQVLVNTVNTAGVMGKGLALDFKRLYPEMFEQYRSLCETRQIQIGTLWLYKTPNKWVLNFPTKKHWREPSRLEYVEAGLKKFVAVYSRMGIHSIAFPALGCGNGQLDFAAEVQPLMEKYLRKLPIEAFVYPQRASTAGDDRNQQGIEQRLQSKPIRKPFEEVWRDLNIQLQEQNSFNNVSTNEELTAQVQQHPQGIVVRSAATEIFLTYEMMMAFWQQLRIYGFSTEHTAPGDNDDVALMISIFSSLHYVAQVQVADEYSKLYSSPSIGLQILPSAFEAVRASQVVFRQTSLFHDINGLS
jgi:O-acetyl-ADP-ribose deacetylase (regulator of RNase III)